MCNESHISLAVGATVGHVVVVAEGANDGTLVSRGVCAGVRRADGAIVGRSVGAKVGRRFGYMVAITLEYACSKASAIEVHKNIAAMKQTVVAQRTC
jgi:hypothetical protein